MDERGSRDSTALTPERVAELLAAVAPGSWEAGVWYGSDEGGWAARGPHRRGSEDGEEPGSTVELQARADAALIAAAPDLARLVLAQAAELERLRAGEQPAIATAEDVLRNTLACLAQGGGTAYDASQLHGARLTIEAFAKDLGEARAEIERMHAQLVRYQAALAHIADGNISPALDFAAHVLAGMSVREAHKLGRATSK